MTDQYKIYTIAADPLRYEPIRADDGSERVFTRADGEAWMCEHVEMLGGLTMTNAETPPSSDALRQLPDGSVLVSYSERDAEGPTIGDWAAGWQNVPIPFRQMRDSPSTLRLNYNLPHRENKPRPE